MARQIETYECLTVWPLAATYSRLRARVGHGSGTGGGVGRGRVPSAAMRPVVLAEELLLLAYDDETGRCVFPLIALDLGMAAAILVDLVLEGRVEVVDGAVVPSDRRPTGHAVVDEILARIDAERPQPAAHWLQ